LGTELVRAATLQSVPQGGLPTSIEWLGTELVRFA
jgi:hypothetical protein